MLAPMPVILMLVLAMHLVCKNGRSDVPTVAAESGRGLSALMLDI